MLIQNGSISRGYRLFDLDTIVGVLFNKWFVLGSSAMGFIALRELENEWFSMPFALNCALVLMTLIFLVSRRFAFSIYFSWAIIGVIGIASFFKHREQGFDLHVYDLVFNFTDTSLHIFLLKNFPHYVLPAMFGIILAVFFFLLTFFHEPRIGSGWGVRTGGISAAFLALPLTIPDEAFVDTHEYLVAGRHISGFFVSFLDLPKVWNASPLLAKLEQIHPQDPFPTDISCPAPDASPDVLIVLSETQTPPFAFPELNLSDQFADGFTSSDGRVRYLGVETFGGGTWISTFSLMTGLSAADFGWQRPYVTGVLEGEIAGSLPQVMAKCGYRTAALLALSYNFVNEGPFLKSIGFETILDMDDLDAPSSHLRDTFYFEKANQFIESHRRSDERPLFLFVETMFPHSPHNDRFEPSISVPGEPLNSDPEIAEYLRRLHISRHDFRDFLVQRELDPGANGTVVLEFGDHQAAVTKRFVERDGRPAFTDWGSDGYRTHFTVHSFGHEMQSPAPTFERLDIAYLGSSLNMAAGLPLSEEMRELLDIRDRCQGLFHSCRYRDLVDKHLRRRLDSGTLYVSRHGTADGGPAATAIAQDWALRI